MILMYLLVTGVAAGYCLLAIWAANGRGHWFARACVLLAALALLVPIRAYEPLVLFGMTSALLVAGWGALGLRRSRPSNGELDTPRADTRGLQFRLTDVLLVCAAAGGASWLASFLVDRGMNLSWWRYGLAAVALAAVVSAAAGVIVSRQRWLAFIALIGCVTSAVAIDRWVLGNWLDADELLTIWRDPMFSERLGLDSLACLYGAFALWGIALSSLYSLAVWRFKSPARAWFVRATIGAIMLPPLALVIAVYCQMLGEHRPPKPASDRENVLPHVLNLARELPSAAPTRAQEILAEAERLSTRPGFIAIDWEELGREPYDLGIDDIQAIRDLGRQLHAKANAKSSAGKHDEAADCALATMRLGAMFQREGLIIHHLVGEAICGMGENALIRARSKLSRGKMLEAIRFLESRQQTHESIEALDARDRLWSDLSQTWRYRLQVALETGIWGEPPYAAISEPMWDLDQRGRCLENLLRTDLAVRAYQIDRGKWPTLLSDLSPTYLAEVLIDPYSGRPFVYRTGKEDFVLYSVGEDQHDNGGKCTDAMTYNTTKGYDLDVDTMIRP